MKDEAGRDRRHDGKPLQCLLATMAILVAAPWLSGCTPLVVGGAVVGAAAKVAVGAAKVPVKATGAVIDAATDDQDED